MFRLAVTFSNISFYLCGAALSWTLTVTHFGHQLTHTHHRADVFAYGRLRGMWDKLKRLSPLSDRCIDKPMLFLPTLTRDTAFHSFCTDKIYPVDWSGSWKQPFHAATMSKPRHLARISTWPHPKHRPSCPISTSCDIEKTFQLDHKTC